MANVVDYAAQGLPSARFGALLAAVLLLITGVVHTLALRPKVIEDGDGLTLVNPFRVHRLPWPMIDSVDTASGPGPLRARAEAGRGAAGRRPPVVHCWALYVSTRARPSSRSGRGRDRGRAQAAARPGRRRARRRLRPAVLPAPRGGHSGWPPSRSARRSRPGWTAGPRRSASGPSEPAERETATTAWSWPAVATVAVPALILLVRRSPTGRAPRSTAEDQHRLDRSTRVLDGSTRPPGPRRSRARTRASRGTGTPPPARGPPPRPRA